MLSFENKKHNLSGLHIIRLPHLKYISKESVFRLLLQRGSLSIEAALVLPLFLFFLLTMIASLNLLCFSLTLQQSLFQEGMYLSEKAYGYNTTSVDSAAEEIRESLVKNAISRESIPVLGGALGLDFSESDFSNPEITEITVKYKAKLIFDPFKLFDREFCQYVTFHNWVGYVSGLNADIGTRNEIYVYITEDSEVYHRDRNCTHIRLKIMEVSSDKIKNIRNEYGEKYTACSHCKAKLKDGKLYVTEDGNCFHNSLECSALTRSVTAIPLSQVGNRRPCSRCGY